MKDISIIIVNYNVRYFVEQCLYSINKAKKNLDIEIFVVDNNSIDDSVDFIRKNFPEVNLIANTNNTGFAKANNQAIKIVDSKYTLLLNPDTLLSEDTLIKVFDFMELNPLVGAAGVKLIDGSGNFLPESKRGFPTPMVSLFRLTGLSRIFPRSKVFNKYNLGYLDENEVNEVDVLCGAFMFIRTEVFGKTGLLDEDFFMYGEDIDFSFRIKKAAYKIVYYPLTFTIHFKGESTKKNSLKYHHSFYNAMSIYAKKHFGNKYFNIQLLFINTAIIAIGIASFLKNNIIRLFLPAIDLILFFSTLTITQFLWAHYYYHDPNYYTNFFTYLFYLGFSLIIVSSIGIYNGYNRNYFVNSIKGTLTACITIFLIYAILPEHLRFSRAIILLGAFLSIILMVLFRIIIKASMPKLLNNYYENKKIAIVGSEEETKKVLRIMDLNGIKYKFSGNISFEGTISNSEKNIGSINKVNEIIQIYKIDEIIFCLKNISVNQVVNYLTEIGKNAKVKIFPDDSNSIIGSSDRNSKGEFYSIDFAFRLEKSNIKFYKYLLDWFLAILFLFFYPVLGLLSKKLKFEYIIEILSGKKSWISYLNSDQELGKLPKLKNGIFIPINLKTPELLTQEEKHIININYAKNYSIWSDIDLLFRHLA
jgi:O-antigen biosynthesis protein